MPWNEKIELAQKSAATLAYLVGAGWVVWNYWLGRTHKSWVQLRISGRRTERGGLEYLIVRAELSNVGHSRVMITPHKSAVDVYAHKLPPKVRIVMRPKWDDSKPIATLAFFDWPGGRKYLEPNSLMIDEVLVAIPGLSDRFLRIDGYVESGKVAWLSRTVVKPAPLPTKPTVPDDKAEVTQNSQKWGGA